MNFKDILNLFREGKATAKSHMKNLIEMATVDGKFAKEENDLLLSIASRNGISASRLEEIRSNPASVPFEVPKDDEEKFAQLYDLVHMMIVDKEIHPEEARLSELFARKFGYPTSSVSGLIETIRNNIQNGSNAAETLTRVQYFLRFSEKAV